MSRINLAEASREELQHFIKLQHDKMKQSREELNEAKTHNNSLKEQLLLHKEEIQVLKSTVASLEDTVNTLQKTNAILQEQQQPSAPTPIALSSIEGGVVTNTTTTTHFGGSELQQRLVDLQTTCDYLTEHLSQAREETEASHRYVNELKHVVKRLEDDKSRLLHEKEDMLVNMAPLASSLSPRNVHKECDEKMAALRTTVASLKETIFHKEAEMVEVVKITEEKMVAQRKAMKAMYNVKPTSTPSSIKTESKESPSSKNTNSSVGFSDSVERKQLISALQEVSKDRDALKERIIKIESDLKRSIDGLASNDLVGQYGGDNIGTLSDTELMELEKWRKEFRKIFTS